MKKDKEAKGMNTLTMNQNYAGEFKKPIRKRQSVEEPNYAGLGRVYKKKEEEKSE